MPAPVVLPYPVKRPNFVNGVTWFGNPGDSEISLNIEYVDAQGLPAQTTLYSTPVAHATLCLPTSKGVNDLPEDVFVAHVRMAGMISGTIPGSAEYEAAIKGDSVLNARNFQMPIGDVKVIGILNVDARTLRMSFQKANGGTVRDIDMDVADLATYAFAPSTQLLTMAGAIKKQFPTYVQDAATNKFLTQAQMDAITAHLLALEPWI